MTEKSRDQVRHNPPIDPEPPLAADLLYGAAAIASYIGLTERQVYHQQKRLGLKHLGAVLVGSKKQLSKLLAGEAA